MIKIRRWFGLTIVSGTPREIETMQGLSGIRLKDGDRLSLLPAHHHVHRNPIRKPIIRHLVDKEEREAAGQ